MGATTVVIFQTFIIFSLVRFIDFAFLSLIILFLYLRPRTISIFFYINRRRQEPLGKAPR
jgi:hypothetical protein